MGRDYRRGHQLGKGGFGVVFECINLRSRDVGGTKLPRGALFAEKVVDLPFENDKQRIEDLEHEIEILAELQHPHIVRYYGSSISGKSRNRFLLFMELVPGGPLTDIVRQFGLLSEVVVQTYTEQILQALEYLHSRGYVHRDLKASNILISTSSVVKVTDFGTCHKLSTLTDGMAIEERLTGTPFFFPPERVLERRIGPQTDVWAVGCVALEMLNGRTPFSTGSNYMQVAYRVGSGEIPQIPPTASDLLKNFISQCFKPAEQRPSASTLLQHPFITETLAAEDDYVATSDEEEERDMATMDQTFTFPFSSTTKTLNWGLATLPSSSETFSHGPRVVNPVGQEPEKRPLLKTGLFSALRMVGLGATAAHFAFLYPGKPRGDDYEPSSCAPRVFPQCSADEPYSFTCKTIMWLLEKTAPAASCLARPEPSLNCLGPYYHYHGEHLSSDAPLHHLKFESIPTRGRNILKAVLGILSAGVLVQVILFLKEWRRMLRDGKTTRLGTHGPRCVRPAGLAAVEGFVSHLVQKNDD